MQIDYELLKRISLEPKNKSKNAFEDSIILSSCLKLFSNIIFELQSLKVNEVALFIHSMNHWITNKKHSVSKKYKAGTIVEYECGLNYQDELSYRHTGLVIEEFDKKIVIIPSSSTQSLIDKSSKKENGLWYYVLVGISEGFNHDCVLLLNDMKTVSKKRVIGSFSNITESESGKLLFNDIKIQLMRHYFSKQVLDNEITIKDLKEDNCRLNEINKKLLSDNELLEKDNEEKSKKIKSLYWILNNQTDYFNDRPNHFKFTSKHMKNNGKK
ncbi:MAG: hypothetical protein NC489_18455 [Ruminococcus flavefaciens]|nr:hypothetical protein [Ruminococcus flavefaciens]